jgi:hypothetical protein
VIWVDRSLMRGRGALIEDCYIPSAVGSSWACAYINKFLHKVLSDDFMLCRDLRLPFMLTERALLQCFTPRYIPLYFQYTDRWDPIIQKSACRYSQCPISSPPFDRENAV